MKTRLLAALSLAVVACASRHPGAPTPDAPHDSAPGGGGVDLLAQWTGCMLLRDFESTNVAPAFSGVQTSDGTCAACHTGSGSSGDAFVVGTPTAMFAAMIQSRAVLLVFFTIDTVTSPNSVVINITDFAQAATGSSNHPTGWDPTNNSGMTALTQFYDLTVAHLDGMAAPTCAN